MKVLLTQPLVALVKDPPRIPDVGIGYLASALKKHRHEVYIRDWNMNPSIENFKQWLTEKNPDIVGVKIFTKDVKAAKETISIIRATLSHVLIIIGGPHPSASEPEELMEDFKECSFAMRGEAEISFPLLLEKINQFKVFPINNDTNEYLSEIAGLVWRVSGKVFHNPVSLIEDLDTIDFPCWEIINPSFYSQPINTKVTNAPIITTRGCPGKCSFCSAYMVNGRRIRSRSAANVFKEMSLLYTQYNVRRFMFTDNCFTARRENMKALCILIIEGKMDIEWDCVSYERLDNLDDETLPLMYKAGCRMLQMGIESGYEKTRKKMNKMCSLKEIAEKVKSIQKHGIGVGGWFMLGFPEETMNDMKETIKYAFSLGANLIKFNIVFPLPGSQNYNYLKEKHGIKRFDWSDFDISNSPYPMSHVPSKKLSKMIKMLDYRSRIYNYIKRLKYLFGVK